MKEKTLSKDARVSEYTPKQTYLSVGLALSYWEASEDVLMGLFNWPCKDEYIALQTYQRSPRGTRTQMLKDALDRYSCKISGEKTGIISSLKKLEKLAKVRNQIAHGHVSDCSRKIDDEVVMEGVFLMPALNERGLPVTREPRYALTSGEIDEFREEVRDHRWEIFQAHMAARTREQNTC